MALTCPCGTAITKRSKTGKCPKCANPEWPQADIDALCDAMADGCSYHQAATRIGRSKDAVVSRWRKIVRSMGVQAA